MSEQPGVDFEAMLVGLAALMAEVQAKKEVWEKAARHIAGVEAVVRALHPQLDDAADQDPEPSGDLFKVTPKEKTCTTCDQTKPVVEFYKHSPGQQSYRPECKECMRSKASTRYANGPRVDDPPETKRCPKCKETKPRAEFGKNRSAKDGLQTYCKPCQRLWPSNKPKTSPDTPPEPPAPGPPQETHEAAESREQLPDTPGGAWPPDEQRENGHTHHWVFDPPNGPTSRGRCGCGAETEQPNSVEVSPWTARVQ